MVLKLFLFLFCVASKLHTQVVHVRVLVFADEVYEVKNFLSTLRHDSLSVFKGMVDPLVHQSVHAEHSEDFTVICFYLHLPA